MPSTLVESPAASSTAMEEPEQVSQPAEAAAAWRRAPVSMAFATVGGIGHLPGGPGTYAAAAFTPLVVWMSHWPLWLRVVSLTVASVLSFYWCDTAGVALREPDSRRIVLDEIIGVWTTLVWFGSLGWISALVGLVAFRILDVYKPPLARQLDEQHNGIAVVLDDVVAGLWAAPIVLLVRWLSG